MYTLADGTKTSERIGLQRARAVILLSRALVFQCRLHFIQIIWFLLNF